jgi:hopene-associated glycosyltransferase HpnB
MLVDDRSSDGTVDVARGFSVAGSLTLVEGTDPPPGWAGKVWAMAQGVAAAGRPEFLLFTDADIAHGPGSVAALVRTATSRRLDLVSQMARLHSAGFWERAVIPAFVYFFAMLYPFRRVNRSGGRAAAAAGGCMLVRREALEAAGGLERIRGALIDDVSLGRLLKRRPGGGGVWLGHATDVVSLREYGFADLWAMVSRAAYTQLRHSPLLLAGTVAGLLVLFAGPAVAAVAGIAGLVIDPSTPAAVAAGCGLAAWALMAATFVPMLRLYGLSPSRAPTLPGVALLYLGMTVDSARRHRRGTGGAWKGRTSA